MQHRPSHAYSITTPLHRRALLAKRRALPLHRRALLAKRARQALGGVPPPPPIRPCILPHRCSPIAMRLPLLPLACAITAACFFLFVPAAAKGDFQPNRRHLRQHWLQHYRESQLHAW